jgi:putative transposase
LVTSPNLNAYAERFARSVKEECLSKLIPTGPGMLKRSVCDNVKHYHQERNHQGVDNRLITPMITWRHVAQTIVRRPRLGGILNFYQRAVA